MNNQGTRFAALEHRGLVTVAGPDSRAFLQGLLSNDLAQGGPGLAQWAALLTPQGKFLHEMFIAEPAVDELWLEAESARIADLVRRLSLYKLRAKVHIAPRPGAVYAAFGEGAAGALGLEAGRGHARAFAGGIAFVDPRLAAAGVHILGEPPAIEQALRERGLSPASAAQWDAHRLRLGLPDGSRDLPIEKAMLLESGFEELAGVSFAKGCYIGQELTARTKHRALIKRRLLPVEIDGPAPAPGTPIMLDGKDAGEMRSSIDGIGLALIRLEALDRNANGAAPLSAGEARLTPFKPVWAILPDTEGQP
ncbi:MAG: folate-binding protein [Proteobacteria bacterium]|nr:folate-binding protein [Pseudomonadota bacterium]